MRSQFQWVAYQLVDFEAKVVFRGTLSACEDLACSRLDLYVAHRPV